MFRVAAGLGVVGAAATPQLRGALTSAALGAGVTTLASNVVTDALGVGVAPDSGWVDPGNLYLCDPTQTCFPPASIVPVDSSSGTPPGGAGDPLADPLMGPALVP